jgi:hypothetical protein
MGWTTPSVRHPEQADLWRWLVVAAYAQLRLARVRVADQRLPWERRYDWGRPTPVRVHRVVSALLAHIGMPANAPKPCGKSRGRPKGRLSGRAKRYPAAPGDYEGFSPAVRPGMVEYAKRYTDDALYIGCIDPLTGL